MVQEVTTKSWGSRILGALFGILIGFALIFCAFFLIFWNEGHGLHTAQSLQQAEKVLITVPITPIDPKNDNKVIYFSGLATTSDTLSDKTLGLKEVAIKLDRKVEMYQWQENTETSTEKQLGGSEKEVKTYTYKQIWSEQIIDSSQFKDKNGHENPTSMPIKSKHQQAMNVTVGDFKLPTDLVSYMTGATDVDLNKSDLSVLEKKIQKTIQHEDDGSLYIGENAQTPKIGDMRISVTEILPQVVSVIAQQAGTTVQAYMAPAGNSVELISMGEKSSLEMIHNAQVENQITTWAMRLVSLVLMIFGFVLIFNPLSVLADVVPIIGSIVGFGTGLVAFIMGLLLWGVATAIAWFAVRPFLAVGILVVIALFCYWLIKRRRNAVVAKS